MTVERSTRSEELTDLSPSRINTAQKCGLAFQYKYVDKLPAPTESASAMFGNAIHWGVAQWYDLGPIAPENKARHKDLDLPTIVNEQWEKLLPPKIHADVMKMAGFDSECEAVVAAIKAKRPELVKPRTTKEFLASQASKDFAEARTAMLVRTDKLKEIKWPQNEDPYTAYRKAHEIAERLQKEWRPLPRPLTVEEPFRLEFEGYVLRGQIDQVRQDPNTETGELKKIRVRDVKSGKQLMTQMEAFVQAWVYNVAVRQIEWLPDDINISDFAMVRHTQENGRTVIQRGDIDRKRHDKLASTILNGVARKILTGQYEPHYGLWCKMCDFRDICETQIAMWKEDGIVFDTE